MLVIKKPYTVLSIFLIMFIFLGCDSRPAANINDLKAGNNFTQDEIELIDSHTYLFPVLEGKLKPDDDIRDKTDIVLKNNPLITYKQLANHTSGIPRWPTFWFRYLTGNPFKHYDYGRLQDDLQYDLKL